ncbi:hypothetical protein NQ317_000906 [Molorchus minor]|uniref:Peptidase aspartic putative domain-containing protein n=1 Tax=Molorchus minor TaxID=1323400 RepID=A0ABQ9IQC5_9CUCU|nr:hypothetical protein NQ317_000906 [Molorchus minor]
MANKLKQADVLRGTAIRSMLELYTLANNAVQEAGLRTLFQMRYKDIHSVRDQFDEQHRIILSSLAIQEGADIEAEQIINSQFESKYYSVQAIYHDLFQNRPAQAPQSQLKSNIKLPKIHIPKFYGDITTWPTFIGLYESLIHNNTSLSNSEKFQYLLSFLDKEPLLLIKNIVVTDINYTVAYESLYKRYQNNRLLATHYWDKITDAPKLTSDSSRSLRFLIDTFTDNISALKNLKYPVDSWDFVLFRSLIKKLDSETLKRFELQNRSSDNPTYQELIEFLLKQCDALDSVSLNNKNKTSVYNKYSPIHKANSPSSSLMVNTHTHATQCYLCKDNHLIYKCPALTSKSPKDRYDLVKQKNCAVPVASGSEIIHFPQTTLSQPSTSQINSLTNVIPTNTTVLLSTAQIEVMNSRGYFETVRVLLDSASQANFITEKCVNRLGLPRSNRTLSVHGLGQIGCSVAAGVTCSIRSRNQGGQVLALDAAPVVGNISNLQLADPEFNVPSSIDMLLGADVFSIILRDGRIMGNINEPTAINTIFGWILMGKVENNPTLTMNSLLSVCDSPLDSTLKRFWELEAIPDQNILSPDDLLYEPIKDFSLNTVTYGVSSAPFLAIKSILQLAEDEKDKYPLASSILSKYTYVDDVVCGCNSVTEGIEIRTQLISLLQSGGFELRKWASNNSDLLRDIPAQDCQTGSFSFDDDTAIKILGFKWSPSLDTFSYEVSPLDRPCTKRTILSELARIFYPLGFLTPLTFLAKYLIQMLWSLGLEWDQTPPHNILKVWIRYMAELPVISNLSIPRHIVPIHYRKCELHAFSDSSEKGYAAVVYFRFILPDNKYVVRLVCGVDSVLERFSSLAKIQRIFAYALRFIHNCKNPSQKDFAPHTQIQLHEALLLLVKRVQHTEFSKEISNLENNLPLTKSFRRLNPFLAEDGVLRVGGRLYFSGLAYDHKYPAILPRNHHPTFFVVSEVLDLIAPPYYSTCSV